MFSSLAVANFFIQKSLHDGKELTPMKLIKLVYLSHGWYLGLSENEEPLITEAVFAWKYGPVIPSLYNKFSTYGRSPIANLQKDENGEIPLINDESIQIFLNRIWEVYSDFKGTELSTITHEANSPWDIIVTPYKGGVIPHNLLIPEKLIAMYYKQKASENEETN